ncbi:hypothetical protein [Kordia jejudonensis]|uniref:hypothetical protein n=1 Tax=Kordia jejudonensis TaxID=1348245 RepID=UPI0006295560|nr:hypothetical protein [Kordia jejudonensis]
MKNQKIDSISLQLKKSSVAKLTITGGAGPNVSELSGCCSMPPLCLFTVTTRPDSIQAKQEKDNVGN